MMYFPVFTQIEGKRCLIVGGGKVAARKVHTLLQYGADIVVIAKKVCDEIKEILPEKSIFEDFIKNEESDFLEKEIQKAKEVVWAIHEAESKGSGVVSLQGKWLINQLLSALNVLLL